MASASAPEADGRVLRGARTRERIVDAVFELVSEGTVRPTAEEVASRAGVGIRTVFRHFDDMEGLHAELNQRMGDQVRPLLEPREFVGTTAARLAEVVALRSRVFERISAARRSGRTVWPPSPEIESAVRDFNGRLRGQLLEAFGPELKTAAPNAVEALDAVLSFESWDRLRSVQRLGRARAAHILEITGAALLGS